MLDLIELGVERNRVAEVHADGVINLRGALVALGHQLLHDLQLLRRRQRLVQLDARSGCELDDRVLREVFHAAAVVARPLVDHRVLAEVDRHESELVEPAGDVALLVHIAAGLARTHRHAEHRIVLEIHRAGQRGDVAVVGDLDGDVFADFLCDVEIHILHMLVEVLV